MSNHPSAEQWAAQLNFGAIEQAHGLPAGILTNLVRQESGGNPNACSPVGARGLCQFMPATAAHMGVDSSDPQSSVNGAARYLEDMMDMFGGDVDKAIAAYNCGPGNVRRAMRHGDDWRSHLPAETRNYLQRVGHGIGGSYAQRVNSGEAVSDTDQTEEFERRRLRLQEAGIDTTNMSPKDILGMMFFMAIFSILDRQHPQATDHGFHPEQPVHVADGSHVTPTPVPASRSAARQPAAPAHA